MHENTSIKNQVAAFLKEDIGTGDLTAALIDPSSTAQAVVSCRVDMILCGRTWFDEVFKQLDANTRIDWHYTEGQTVSENSVICSLSGPAQALLTGERTALNLLQTLSATATAAGQFAQAVAGSGCKVLDTRKTIPGLRLAQKYAVTVGGCHNHRSGLYDAILIKENHIFAAGSIERAVAKAKQSANVMIEVEVENLHEFQQAVDAGADRIMLDNFHLQDLRTAVTTNHHDIELEASGNITLNNIRTIAETGVDYISIGALTKHIQAIDLSMRITLE